MYYISTSPKQRGDTNAAATAICVASKIEMFPVVAVGSLALLMLPLLPLTMPFEFLNELNNPFIIEKRFSSVRFNLSNLPKEKTFLIAYILLSLGLSDNIFR